MPVSVRARAQQSGFAVLRCVLALCAGLAIVSGLQNAGAAEGAAAPAVQSSPKPVVIQGFKSARFGMDEARLRVAIAKDFGIGEEGVKEFTNEEQHTTVLRIVAPRLNRNVPDHPTVISYILDPKKKELIQINLVWGTDLTPGLSVPDLNTKAALYRQQLLSRNFPPERTKTSGVLKDGSRLLFASSDEEGHSVLLRTRIVQVARSAGNEEPEQKSPAPETVRVKRLLLSYIDNRGILENKTGQ